MRGVEKTRLYWRRIDIFVLMRLVWYMGTEAQKYWKRIMLMELHCFGEIFY
jgi:hypothetical protein